MTTDTARPSYWQISEVVFGVPLLAGIGLQWVLPLQVSDGAPRGPLIVLGVLLLVLGSSLAISARREFARHSQSMEPKRSISRIVDSGVFSISRNPLYLGVAIALAGVALAFNNLWILVMLIPAAIACHHVLIAPEERYLRQRFSQEYVDYTTRVRRWLGRR